MPKSYKKRLIYQSPKERRSITRLILEKIAELGEASLDALLPPNYPEARIWRNLLGLDQSYPFSPRTFSSILSRLRGQGLVTKRGNNRRTLWSLTQKGGSLLGAEQFLPPVDGIPRLVIFDVPEVERKKRDAIRNELVSFDFEQLQKSVWLGYRPLPEDFIELLDVLNMKKHVHILSIKEQGTVKEA